MICFGRRERGDEYLEGRQIGHCDLGQAARLRGDFSSAVDHGLYYGLDPGHLGGGQRAVLMVPLAGRSLISQCGQRPKLVEDGAGNAVFLSNPSTPTSAVFDHGQTEVRH